MAKKDSKKRQPASTKADPSFKTAFEERPGTDFPYEIMNPLLESASSWAQRKGMKPEAFNRWQSLSDDFYVLVSASMIEALIGDIVQEEMAKSTRTTEESNGIAKIVSRMNFGGPTGVLELASAYGRIEPGEKKSVTALFALRNEFAHNPSCLGMTVDELIARLPSGKRDQILNGLYFEFNEFNQVKGQRHPSITRWLVRTIPLFVIRRLANKLKNSTEQTE